MTKAAYQCDACGEEWPCLLSDAMLEGSNPEHCPFSVDNKAEWRALVPEVDKCPRCGSNDKEHKFHVTIKLSGSPLVTTGECTDSWHDELQPLTHENQSGS